MGMRLGLVHVNTIRLVTGIVILPQRNPVVLAKEVASLDVLSGGRVTLGVGAGYLEPEFRALGANYAERGAVTDEYIDAMRSLWHDPQPAYNGWYGYGLTPERAAECVAAERFAAAGVHRLVVLIQPEDGGPERAIESGATAVAGL
jgi:alkanesulfonate monooxygenase SsuD/methylene tetrahydromethanopterin reductase-like flavin-dependent oxidoreductase (luciferase family)